MTHNVCYDQEKRLDMGTVGNKVRTNVYLDSKLMKKLKRYLSSKLCV